jgi:hypothetical protein
LKQNVVTLSSTTLQQHNSNISPLANQTNPSENSTNANLNNNNTNLGRSSTTSILTNASINNNSNEIDYNKQLTTVTKSKSFSTFNTQVTNYSSNASVRRSATLESDATSRHSIHVSDDNFQFEIVDKPIIMSNVPIVNKQQRGVSNARPASTISNGSIFSMTSPLLNYLQYGDVLIKCNATS